MQDVFITKIHIGNVRHLHDVAIPLSDTERKHLILTGKNGSGKTSVLEAIAAEWHNEYVWIQETTMTKRFLDNVVTLNTKQNRSNILFLKDLRKLGTEKIKAPNSVNKYDENSFLQYLTNVNYWRFLAQDEGNAEDMQKYERWLSTIKRVIRQMYSDDNLELVPRKNDYLIRLSDGQEFGIDQMARGYEVLLCTFAAIMGEMDSATDNAYDYTLSGIVLIDEIETHLHVALQKRVLCMLTELFPNAQFIVTTHSPFVITSLEDAIVFDLEKKERLSNPTIYSYEAIVEGYLDVGQYSLTIKDTFSRYKELCAKERSNAESEELQQIVSKLELVPPASKELYLAFRTMEDKRKR